MVDAVHAMGLVCQTVIPAIHTMARFTIKIVTLELATLLVLLVNSSKHQFPMFVRHVIHNASLVQHHQASALNHSAVLSTTTIISQLMSVY